MSLLTFVVDEVSLKSASTVLCDSFLVIEVMLHERFQCLFITIWEFQLVPCAVIRRDLFEVASIDIETR